jgi:hypothetical protein
VLRILYLVRNPDLQRGIVRIMDPFEEHILRISAGERWGKEAWLD